MLIVRYTISAIHVRKMTRGWLLNVWIYYMLHHHISHFCENLKVSSFGINIFTTFHSEHLFITWLLFWCFNAVNPSTAVLWIICSWSYTLLVNGVARVNDATPPNSCHCFWWIGSGTSGAAVGQGAVKELWAIETYKKQDNG